MNNVFFRFATNVDIDQLVDLRVLMQLEVNKFSEMQVTAEYREKVKMYFQDALQNKKYFSAVAESGSAIVGTAGVCFYEKPPSLFGGTGLVGYVTNVYTMESFRGQGVGTELMRKLNELAQNLQADKLHLGATTDGLSIYKAVGYSEPRFVNLEIKEPFITNANLKADNI